MKKITFISAIIIALSLSIFAQTNKTEQDIKSLAAEFANSVVKRDTAVMERLLADDFKIVSENGRRLKSEFINGFKTPLPKEAGTFEAIDLNHSEVRVYGDTAIMTAKNTHRGKTADGQARSQDNSVTMLAVKKKGQWQIVGLHISRVPDPTTETTSSNEMKKNEQNVMALAGEFANAIFKRDSAAMERLLADNYIETRPNGVRLDKIDLVNNFKTPLPENAGTLNMPEISSPILHMFGDTAIMSSRVTTSGKDAKGEAFNGNFLYTMTAVENNGRWQIAGIQSIEIPSRIPPAGMGNHCKLDKGPLAGQTQDYSHIIGAYPIGTPCSDGRGSSGKVVAPPSSKDEKK